MQLGQIVQNETYLEMKVGDVVPSIGGDRALFCSGQHRWYALLCRTQCEEKAERWLSARGVYAFHPVTRRKVRVQGQSREYNRRYLPGYVFARFGGAPICHRVLASPFLTGALTMSSGEWGALGGDQLRSLHEMRARDRERDIERKEQKRRARHARRVRAGATALFRAGPLVGQKCEVVEVLSDGGVKVRFNLFAQEALVRASVDDLVGLPG